jgi:hypothetical protein
MADAGKKQKTPEPTFKSDVDNMVSELKKVDRKINDTLDPNGILRKGIVKAAGKEERGILGDYSDLSRDFPEKKEAPKVIPMTVEDKKVLNSSKFKKASEATMDKKKGGMIKKMASGGSVGSASKRADGIAVKGKTRGKIC